MITFEGTDYFTQQEVAEYLHCTKATIANKISVSGIQGVRFGRMKYYTAAQRDKLLYVTTTPQKQ